MHTERTNSRPAGSTVSCSGPSAIRPSAAIFCSAGHCGNAQHLSKRMQRGRPAFDCTRHKTGIHPGQLLPGLAGQGHPVHGKALLLRAERQRTIASNIANADTPGYVARDMDFASALRAASGTQSVAGAALAAVQGALQGTPDGGFAARTETFLRYAAPSQSNLDGNSVDMDRERASFADNSVKYEATLRFINGHVRTMLDAMKSHQQG